MSDGDPRLLAAVEGSRRWYDDVFALHAIPAAADDRLWWALGEPPAYHSTAKTLRPGVETAAVLAAVRGPGAVADSFADLELPGFTLLFEAAWVHHPGGSVSGLPQGWSVVTDPQTLSQWGRLHDYAGVLPPPTLRHPAFTVLAHHEGADLVGGAVLHDGAGTVDLSNAWALPSHTLEWTELASAAQAVHPGRALTGYAGGEELQGLLSVGFEAVGPQRVWMRRGTD